MPYQMKLKAAETMNSFQNSMYKHLAENPLNVQLASIAIIDALHNLRMHK